jgi:hypothetical protein
MSWRDKPTEDCEMCRALYRDDGAPLGCVLRIHGGEATYAYATTGCGAWARASPTTPASSAVERAVCTEEGALW